MFLSQLPRGKSTGQEEHQPLLRSLSEASVNRIWLAVSVGALVVAWCVLDSWNHTTISGIFQMGEPTEEVLNPFTGQFSSELKPFNYTLTLAFLQFAFMAMVFSLIFALHALSKGDSVGSNLEQLRSSASSG